MSFKNIRPIFRKPASAKPASSVPTRYSHLPRPPASTDSQASPALPQDNQTQSQINQLSMERRRLGAAEKFAKGTAQTALQRRGEMVEKRISNLQAKVNGDKK